ncbi:peptide-methionine (S)-S-oxide reductase MsrA [Allochromatium vinosum]|uniref:peptide-methionine (S)-S-oxide reductase MsrA n=1 Tax=Allochromatium vinosum TaxID=1049 RepID=UPI0019041379|nr:peptide-methionine (S)-S-oxide reductase MsrA [Allochromatium vinosum]MBK1656084.1 peptide-methionine (S)-S-oxide reductase [Allochromatium vinosum]
MTIRKATLGGGCFWCLEAVFQSLAGVESVLSGYAGGSIANPTYQQICTGTTGHAEVVRIEFDDQVIDYETLLDVFFATHDPTTRDRQGADVGSQYRSVIFHHDDGQRAGAEAVIARLNGGRIWPAPIVTQIEPVPTFYPAEGYHQNYYRRYPTQGYCQAVIAPKLAKLRRSFRDLVADEERRSA